MTPYGEQRFGRVRLSIPFVAARAQYMNFFKDFAIIYAKPLFEEPDIIAYYGAHPDFEPYYGDSSDTPYYSPYWNDRGELYFKKDR